MKKLLPVVLTLLFFMALPALAAAAEKDKGMAFPKDWESYQHIGSLIITNKNHPLFGIHHFYMNNIGLDAFTKGRPYPDGTIIVDAVYEIVEQPDILNEGKRAFFPVMKKNSKMKDTGGWEWAAFSTDGKSLGKDPKKDCLSCHDAAKDTDYVFSKPLE